MKVTEDAKTFQKLFPLMMQNTRLLIIDHDILRYHSFDLVRYLLFRDIGRFSSLRKDYAKLLAPNVELADRVYFMQHSCYDFNVFDMFVTKNEYSDVAAYSGEIQKMLADQTARIVPTDISDRFGVVFDRKGISGYLLRYPNDPNKPPFYNKLTVYESPTLLDLKVAVAIIVQENINAVMVSNIQLAVELSLRLIKRGILQPMTFIIGSYRYNYIASSDPLRTNMKCFEEMTALEAKLRYEFGFFDPFSGLTYRNDYGDIIVQGDATDGR